MRTLNGKVWLNLVILMLLITACQTKEDSWEPINVIPEPVSLQHRQGHFTITAATKIQTDTTNSDLNAIAHRLAGRINSATWYDIEVEPLSAPATDVITLALNPNSDSLKSESSYSLLVYTGGATITARTPRGIFYGVQTLRQLLPPTIEYKDPTLVPQDVEWRIPAVEINDTPRFAYRGMHLDVGRHFFPVKFIKRYIDLLAMYKMNRFHWHLTEDQGWRIQIKKYPKLTEVGAWRDSTLVGHYGSGKYDNKRYGGFYTQDEIREVVEYAKERYVTIIPEIEMPGHSSAALAAYPQLGCKENASYHVQNTWGIFEDIYCPKEEAFTFLENVLTEVMDLFPSQYIHIGGDEAPKKQWKESPIAQQVMKREGLKNENELQSYFIARIEKFLNDHGRNIIGWDEILEGGLAPNATVMSWRGVEGGIEAARQHHNVVMTPNATNYLDHYQADPETEPLAIGGFTTLEKTYSYEPVPEELNEEEAKYILGTQGNVWTEYIHSGNKVEYMAYPRAIALAEVNWTPAKKKNFTLFWRRLQSHFKRLDIMGINAAEHYRGKMPVFKNQ